MFCFDLFSNRKGKKSLDTPKPLVSKAETISHRYGMNQGYQLRQIPCASETCTCLIWPDGFEHYYQEIVCLSIF